MSPAAGTTAKVCQPVSAQTRSPGWNDAEHDSTTSASPNPAITSPATRPGR